MATVEQPAVATDSKEAAPATTAEAKEIDATVPIKKRKKPDSPAEEDGPAIKKEAKSDDALTTEETEALVRLDSTQGDKITKNYKEGDATSEKKIRES